MKFEEILQKRFSRRKFIATGATALAATTMLHFPGLAFGSDNMQLSGIHDFQALKEGGSDKLELSDAFKYDVVIGWGDELFTINDSSHKSLAQIQELSFGYNNDYVAFFPFNDKDPTSGLLCVNHEYPIPKLMYNDSSRDLESVQYDMASVGHTIVEVKNDTLKWQYVKDSKYNRRITALSTPINITGPAAGSNRLKTSVDNTGTKVIGTLANCSGGKTPWKTVLSCEENIQEYFGGILPVVYDKNNQPIPNAEQANFKRMGLGKYSKYNWENFVDRFNISREPNEANRFGWVVEIDPFNPNSIPKKRTALGRFRHESCQVVVNSDNRLVIYMGDDENFEHIYKYVSNDRYNYNSDPSSLLDNGVLYTAKFDDFGKIEWLPLVFGATPLDTSNDFNSQGDVLIETRKAAKLLGATEMDRPEGIAYDQRSENLYVSLTMNLARVSTNAPNPIPDNVHGHIIQITPDNKDHTSTKASWEIYRMGGENKSFSNPDNIIVSPKGELWVATDGMPKSRNVADGFFLFDKTDSLRMLNAPTGAEITGPEFTPDGKTLFLSIQHPGEGSDYSNPSTRWPDFSESVPPRPAVVAISKKSNDMI